MSSDTNYHVLNLIEQNPELSQRQLASELGISLGKVNYCLRALIEKGFVKSQNFKKSDNKTAYLYLLTPKGVREKTRVTHRYLQRKLREYDEIGAEIARLQAKLDAD